MATYAQLEAEPWWGREIVTAELDWLGDELCRRTGRPRVAAGSKGDNLHLRGAHRSQEWILHSRWCTNRTYTVQAGLTKEQLRHIAGFDFTPGSAAEMVAQCQRLMVALKAGQIEEIREFYGNVDGDKVVDGWDNLTNRAATSDSSHLWHWHLSIDRTKLRDQKLMERITAIALGDPSSDHQEEDVLGLKRGDTGPRVRALQALLSYAGHPVEGGVDGEYGPATSAALVALRRAEGSDNPSGDLVDEWAYRQIHGRLASVRAEAAAAESLRQAKAAIEQALAALPGLPDTITIDLPDTITVPVGRVGDES